MAEYRVLFDGELEDEVFSSYEDADEYGLYLQSCCEEGAETLNLSNPGDYDYDEDCFDAPDYEVVEID